MGVLTEICHSNGLSLVLTKRRTGGALHAGRASGYPLPLRRSAGPIRFEVNGDPTRFETEVARERP